MGDSVPDLTSGIKQLGESGGLSLSGDAVTKVQIEIDKFQHVLQQQQGTMKGLKISGNPGNYASGSATKDSLNHDSDAIANLLQSYLDYLEEFSTAVHKHIGGIVENG
jgi:hypothetical protein